MKSENWFVVYEYPDGKFELITNRHDENRFHGCAPKRAYITAGAPDRIRKLCEIRTTPFGEDPKIVEIKMPSHPCESVSIRG